MEKFSYIDKSGEADKVDVGTRKLHKRRVNATGTIFLAKDTLKLRRDNQIKKGDILTVAQIAGMQAVKQTALPVPLCSLLTRDKNEAKMQITSLRSKARCIECTGVEMEILTAVGISLLSVYDLCKAVNSNMQISQIKLLGKVKEDVE